MNTSLHQRTGRLPVYILSILVVLALWAAFSYLGKAIDPAQFGDLAPYIGIVVYLIWLPGSLLAAIAFPGGLHSASPLAYLWLSVFIDAFLWAWPVMLVIESVRKRWDNRN